MIGKNNLWPEELVQENGQFTMAATLERPDGTRRKIWYRLPIAYRDAVTSSCDSFVLGFLFTIMKMPEDLRVHGEVSPSLLRNLVEFQDAWTCWKPAKYHRIEISADIEREQPRAKTDEAIMGFSRGSDSSYTAWRHRTGRAGRQQRNLVAGVMIHGFDIPVQEADVFARAADTARTMLASLNMELIPIATNFREVGGTWEDAFGAGLASCLSLLQGRYNTGLIASGLNYSNLVFPWGSTPLTDGLMSSDSFLVIQDGTALTKEEKIIKINEWPEARKHMRVCFDGRFADNCCRCAKCMRTILLFRLLGLDFPECFERDISNGDILRLRLTEADYIYSMELLVKQAHDASISASWVRALKLSTMVNRLRLTVNRIAPQNNILRRIYRFFIPPP